MGCAPRRLQTKRGSWAQQSHYATTRHYCDQNAAWKVGSLVKRGTGVAAEEMKCGFFWGRSRSKLDWRIEMGISFLVLASLGYEELCEVFFSIGSERG